MHYVNYNNKTKGSGFKDKCKLFISSQIKRDLKTQSATNL